MIKCWYYSGLSEKKLFSAAHACIFRMWIFSAGLWWETPSGRVQPPPVSYSSGVSCFPHGEPEPLLSPPPFLRVCCTACQLLTHCSSLLSTDTTVSSQKGKTLLNQSPTDPQGFLTRVLRCVCFHFLLMRWKSFHGGVDVDLNLSHSVFLLHNKLFDYKVNHWHPLTPRRNDCAVHEWSTAHSLSCTVLCSG